MKKQLDIQAVLRLQVDSCKHEDHEDSHRVLIRWSGWER
jgi:hypothetical protein